jgi:hypothetical protein
LPTTTAFLDEPPGALVDYSFISPTPAGLKRVQEWDPLIISYSTTTC